MLSERDKSFLGGILFFRDFTLIAGIMGIVADGMFSAAIFLGKFNKIQIYILFFLAIIGFLGGIVCVGYYLITRQLFKILDLTKTIMPIDLQRDRLRVHICSFNKFLLLVVLLSLWKVITFVVLYIYNGFPPLDPASLKTHNIILPCITAGYSFFLGLASAIFYFINRRGFLRILDKLP